jgi:glycosyltransferase involved in cell wall biosynthesis
MIVKNEAHNLRECLMCLQPVLTQVDSELIIADTGSEDETVAISREFTENVLQIPWNDDFAEARNYTVRAAKGEWYMYLDADEFFEDTGDLIDFFNNGLYKRYNSATYHVRNYQADNVQYNIFNAPRLVKMNKDTRFTGIIHEYLPAEPPRRDLTSHVRHTGYAFTNDPEKERRKHERNIRLMMRIYNQNPSDLRNVALITNEYMGIRLLDECKKYIDIGMRFARVNDGTNPLFHFFYHKLAFYYLALDTPENDALAADTINEYLKRRKGASVTSIDMYFYLGTAYYKMGKYAEASEALRQCYDLTKEYLTGRLDMAEATVVVADNASEQGLRQTAVALADCYGKMLSAFKG